MSLFVERLKEYMQEADLNKTTFAEEIGFNRNTVSRVLNGRHSPSTPFFIACCEYFNCSADYLLGLIEYPHTDKYLPVKPFSGQLRKCLAESKKTEYRLQKDLNLSPTVTTRWLRNIAVPTIESYVRLSKYFGCSVDYLLGRE